MELFYAMYFFAEQYDSKITFCNFRSFPMARKLYLLASWFFSPFNVHMIDTG